MINLTLDLKPGNSGKTLRKREVLGICFLSGLGSLIPKSNCEDSDQKVNIFVKTKNGPKRGGGGGGVRHLGEIPKKSRF